MDPIAGLGGNDVAERPYEEDERDVEVAEGVGLGERMEEGADGGLEEAEDEEGEHRCGEAR